MVAVHGEIKHALCVTTCVCMPLCLLQEDALVVFTLVDPRMVDAATSTAALYGVRYVDLWSQLLDRMEDHLNAQRRCVVAMCCCATAHRWRGWGWPRCKGGAGWGCFQILIL